jgi:hypothetical protein
MSAFAMTIFSPAAAARNSARGAQLPKNMLRQYQANPGTEVVPAHVAERSIVNNEGYATPGRLKRAMEKFSPNSVFDGLNLASVHSYGEPTDDVHSGLKFNLEKLCEMAKDPTAECVEYVPPTKEQAERINIARLAALKMISPYIKNVPGASKKLAPIIMVNSEWLGKRYGEQGQTFSQGTASFVRIGADLTPEQIMAMAYHEICHSHSHPIMRNAFIQSGSTFLQFSNEQLTERIASEWTQVFDDMIYETVRGGAAFAECVIKLLGDPSEKFPKGGYKAGFDTLMRAYFSGDIPAIEKCMKAVIDVGHWMEEHGDPKQLSLQLDEKYSAEQGIDIHHEDELFSSNDEMPAKEAVKNGFFQGENLQGVAFGALTAAALAAGAVVAARAASAKDKTGAPQEGTDIYFDSLQYQDDIYFDSLQFQYQYQDVPENKLAVAAKLKEPEPDLSLSEQMQSLASILAPQANN